MKQILHDRATVIAANYQLNIEAQESVSWFHFSRIRCHHLVQNLWPLINIDLSQGTTDAISRREVVPRLYRLQILRQGKIICQCVWETKYCRVGVQNHCIMRCFEVVSKRRIQKLFLLQKQTLIYKIVAIMAMFYWNVKAFLPWFFPSPKAHSVFQHSRKIEELIYSQWGTYRRLET